MYRVAHTSSPTRSSRLLSETRASSCGIICGGSSRRDVQFRQSNCFLFGTPSSRSGKKAARKRRDEKRGEYRVQTPRNSVIARARARARKCSLRNVFLRAAFQPARCARERVFKRRKMIRAVRLVRGCKVGRRRKGWWWCACSARIRSREAIPDFLRTICAPESRLVLY